MAPRAIGPILTDIAAIDNNTTQAAIQGLRDEIIPYLQLYGDPRTSALWAQHFTAGTVSKVTRMLVSGWYHEQREQSQRYPGSAGLANIAFLT